eukprot:CAMPEP_0202866756 /NCGR_PEP_ID=MMETSP1391-20130828/8345_1 /ASSEMBLY_ACC=CAM_ASM_000867 /TAXON_ID=1034604 /ORGANISM="Chlamydomonas leiostraca, Strain SAG 11-49" /LENGTH=97 /DNA_ID=CAMNT_0049546737 /DNA_START=459 /DNA_END=752 /DNA_ORIENTATION=+
MTLPVPATATRSVRPYTWHRAATLGDEDLAQAGRRGAQGGTRDRGGGLCSTPSRRASGNGLRRPQQPINWGGGCREAQGPKHGVLVIFIWQVQGMWL